MLEKRRQRRILVAVMNWLRKILGRCRRGKIPNESTRNKLGLEITLLDKIKKRRLTWFGCVTRMEGNRLPAVILYGQVEEKRSRARKSKKLMDNVKEDIKA